MLKIHQRMGLITTIPLIATFITSANAGGKNTSTPTRAIAYGSRRGDGGLIFHDRLLCHPRAQDPGTETRGPIRLHKAMAWIHGPGMILTPILGAMAYQSKEQRRKGSRDRIGARAGGHRHGRGLWGRS